MKSEWEFTFEASDCHLERTHKYRLSSADAVEVGKKSLRGFECLVELIPLDDEPPAGVEQLGTLRFTLPMPPEECEEFAYWIARVMLERIFFHSGVELRLHHGVVCSKRIAETPEEEEEIGDQPHFVTLRLREIIPTPSLDLSGKIFGGPIHSGLMAQYNETRRDISPTRKFLGFFRIIENCSYRGRKSGPLKATLRSHEGLRRYFSHTSHGDQTFDDFVDEIVDIRHRCAHLKLDNNFGYLSTDPEVENRITPLLPIMDALAHVCVQGV